MLSAFASRRRVDPETLAHGVEVEFRRIPGQCGVGERIGDGGRRRARTRHRRAPNAGVPTAAVPPRRRHARSCVEHRLQLREAAGDLGLRHTERLIGPLPIQLVAVAVLPPGERVGQVVLRVSVVDSSIGWPVRFALFSASVWRSSRPLTNNRYVSCSITSSGLEMPPAQKSFHTASICDFSSPVITTANVVSSPVVVGRCRSWSSTTAHRLSTGVHRSLHTNRGEIHTVEPLVPHRVFPR